MPQFEDRAESQEWERQKSSDGDFYEEDENIEDLLAEFEAGSGDGETLGGSGA